MEIAYKQTIHISKLSISSMNTGQIDKEIKKAKSDIRASAELMTKFDKKYVLVFSVARPRYGQTGDIDVIGVLYELPDTKLCECSQEIPI